MALLRSEFRTWTDRTGNKTIEAELLQGDEQRVQLRLQTGKVITSRLGLFSERDQEFVRKSLASSNSLENTKTKPSEETRAKESTMTHVLSGRLASGAVLKGSAKQPGFGTWACRLEISQVQNNSFKGVLHLDSAKVGHAEAFVNASLEIEGQLQGSEGVHFTVTRIRQQSRHPEVFLDDDNIGLAYRGLVRGNRIVGQTYSRPGSSAATLTMEFATSPEPAKVVALGTETSPATPRKRERPTRGSTAKKPSADGVTSRVAAGRPSKVVASGRLQVALGGILRYIGHDRHAQSKARIYRCR